MSFIFTKTNGNAGTGKTHKIASMIDHELREGNSVYVITPTNKAAQVLRSRLPHNGVKIGTIASIMYDHNAVSYDPKKYEMVKKLHPETGKFERDEFGNIVEERKEVKKYIKVPKLLDDFAVVFIDESSMVGTEFWTHLIHGISVEDSHEKLFFENIIAVHTFGDEKQLPPVEHIESLSDLERSMVSWWFDLPADTTLTFNHRQNGSLHEFITICTNSLFKGWSGLLPVPLYSNDSDLESLSWSVDICSELLMDAELNSVIYAIDHADIIVVPTNKLRKIFNCASRKLKAHREGQVYQVDPVVGDQIIFKSKCREAPIKGTTNYTYIPKNTYGVIKQICDSSLSTTGISCIIELETGQLVGPMVVDYSHTVPEKWQFKKKMIGAPEIDYGYAVTAHSSQGGGWDNVVVFDQWSSLPTAKNIRYVAITRAKKTIRAFSGVSEKKGHLSLLLDIIDKKLD